MHAQKRVHGLLESIPHSQDNEFFYFSRENLAPALSLLKDSGFDVSSLEQEINSLHPLNFTEAQNKSFGYYILEKDTGYSPNEVTWKKYSFSNRQMFTTHPHQTKDNEWAFFLQEDQVVIAFNHKHFLGYYLAEDHLLRRCKTPQEALEKCHQCSFPAKLYFEKKASLAPYVMLYNTDLWLPPRHYEVLYKRLCGLTPAANNNFALLHQLDIPLVIQILHNIGIELIEGQPPRYANAPSLEMVELASEVTQQAYTAYLKSEVGVGEFESIVSDYRWENLEPPDFRELLTELSNQAYNFDLLSEELLSYLIDRLPQSFDWKTLRDNDHKDWFIKGVILDRDVPKIPATNMHGELSIYYKIIIQELGLVLGAMSKRHLLSTEEGQVKPAFFIASNWRLIPYAGRLKLTGNSASIITESIMDQSLEEEGFSYIYGIPHIESQLAQDVYLSAFFLDRDTTYWHGKNEFSRYFASYAQVIKNISTDLDLPATLFKDAFNQLFYLTYTEIQYHRYQDIISSLKEGQWLHFIAHVGLHAHLTKENNIPIFEITYLPNVKEITNNDILEAVILGLLRYYEHLEYQEILSFLEASTLDTEALKYSLESLKIKQRIIHSDNTFYYSYTFCSSEERLKIIDAIALKDLKIDTQKFYQGLRPFLPMIHPLRYGQKLRISNETDSSYYYRNKLIVQADRHFTIITRRNYQDKEEKAKDILNNYGIFIFRVHPWNINYALDLIKNIRKAFPLEEIKIQRKDTQANYMGENIIETWFRLYCTSILTRRTYAEQLRQSHIASRVIFERPKKNTSSHIQFQVSIASKLSLACHISP